MAGKGAPTPITEAFATEALKTAKGKAEAVDSLNAEIYSWKVARNKMTGCQERLKTLLASESAGAMVKEVLSFHGVSPEDLGISKKRPAPEEAPRPRTEPDPNLEPAKKIKTAQEKEDPLESLRKRGERIARGELSKSSKEKKRLKEAELRKKAETAEALAEALELLEKDLLERERQSVEEQMKRLQEKK